MPAEKVLARPHGCTALLSLVCSPMQYVPKSDGLFNPVKLNGNSLYYYLEQSISVLRDVGWYFSFLFKMKENIIEANSGDPDQMPHSAASDLGLHCLTMSHKKDALLICINIKTGEYN